MTMPIFEPITKVIVFDEAGMKRVFSLQKPLHPSDQLQQAFEAGKIAGAVTEDMMLSYQVGFEAGKKAAQVEPAKS